MGTNFLLPLQVVSGNLLTHLANGVPVRKDRCNGSGSGRGRPICHRICYPGHILNRCWFL